MVSGQEFASWQPTNVQNLTLVRTYGTCKSDGGALQILLLPYRALKIDCDDWCHGSVTRQESNAMEALMTVHVILLCFSDVLQCYQAPIELKYRVEAVSIFV